MHQILGHCLYDTDRLCAAALEHAAEEHSRSLVPFANTRMGDAEQFTSCMATSPMAVIYARPRQVLAAEVLQCLP